MKVIKKAFSFIPYALAPLVLLISLFFISQALWATEPLPFVGYGGTYDDSATVFGISQHVISLALGVIISVIMAVVTRKKCHFSIVGSLIFSILLVALAFLGSKLMFAIEKFLPAPSSDGLDFSGLSMFGGVFTALIYVALFAIIVKKDILQLFDYTTPIAIMLLSFVRVGCFITGCCDASVITVGGKPLKLPLQLFEIVCYFIILAAVTYISRKRISNAKKNEPNAYRGTLFFITVTAYGACRFVLEFFRDSQPILLGLTFGQIHSITSIVIGVSVLILLRRRFLLDSKARKEQKRQRRK